MGISHNGWAHTPIQGWWALALWRQLGENSEVEYSCHWARAWKSLEMQWVVLSSHNGNNYQTEEARFWNKVCLTIQLTRGCSHQIPSVSTAERLSAQLGPMPEQYLMLLPLSEPAHSPTWRQISMRARWNARYAERAVSEWRLNYPGALIGGSLQSGVSRVSWFMARSLSFPCVFVCLRQWCPH